MARRHAYFSGVGHMTAPDDEIFPCCLENRAALVHFRDHEIKKQQELYQIFNRRLPGLGFYKIRDLMNEVLDFLDVDAGDHRWHIMDGGVRVNFDRDFAHIQLSVWANGEEHHCRMQVDAGMMQDHPHIFGWTLDDMVEALDRQIAGKTRG